MAQLNDNLEQGNRGGRESDGNDLHKSLRNQDSQKYETTPAEEKLKEKNNDEKFSPGEDPNYNAEEFSTD